MSGPGLTLPYILGAFFALSLSVVLLLAQIKLFSIDKSLKLLIKVSKRQEVLLKRLEAKSAASETPTKDS